jgi:hypothetical protein
LQIPLSGTPSVWVWLKLFYGYGFVKKGKKEHALKAHKRMAREIKIKLRKKNILKL